MNAVPSLPAEKPARPRWTWWLLGTLSALVVLALTGLALLDPWLRRTLEKQVAQQTHGQYRLQIGSLHVSLWQRALRLENLRLRPATAVADTLPRLRLDVARLHVTGVGLWAVLRKQIVPIDSLLFDSARVQVLVLAKKAPHHTAPPLYQQLPLKLPGLRLRYVALRRTQATYGPDAQPTAGFRQGSLTGHDLLISAVGAADTTRLAYGAAWQLALDSARTQVAAHQLTLGHLRFSTATQRLQLDSLRLLPPAPGADKPGAVRLNLRVPRLAVTGLRAAPWQHRRHFQADSLLVEAPRLAVTPPAQPPPDLWKLLAPLARRSDVGCLVVRDGSVRVQGLAHKPSVQRIQATGQGFRIDSTGFVAPTRILYARAWTVRTGRLAATFEEGVYQAQGDHLILNTAARTLRLEGLTMTPAFTPAQLNRRYGYQIAQVTARVPRLTVTGLDFATLAQRGQVRAARLTVSRPLIRIASDGRGPINPHRSVITPEVIRRVPLHFDVRRLDLVSGNLYTRYRSPLSPVAGTISINRFNGTLRNVSNDPRRQTAATPLTGMATAYLQNRCRLVINVAVPLRDLAGRHRVWGSFGAGPFHMLNSMTVPTRLVEFRKGSVQRIDFALQGDKKQVAGQMTARYTGLQLALLSYKAGEIKQPLGKRIISKVANVVVIRDQNPRKGGRVVSGKMTSKREPRFSVFTLWRQGIISGLLNSIGLPQPLAQKISQTQDAAPLPK